MFCFLQIEFVFVLHIRCYSMRVRWFIFDVIVSCDLSQKWLYFRNDFTDYLKKFPVKIHRKKRILWFATILKTMTNSNSWMDLECKFCGNECDSHAEYESMNLSIHGKYDRFVCFPLKWFQMATTTTKKRYSLSEAKQRKTQRNARNDSDISGVGTPYGIVAVIKNSFHGICEIFSHF